MKNIQDIIDWLVKSEDIQIDGASSIDIKYPLYEITPKDFLKYAEEDLSLESEKGKIGVISNLKRALDCQLDIFFETINIKRIFDKNNLKFERKTQFLADIGILPNKAINKLNKIRNKMEHDYVIPELEDLDVYFELVWNVVEIINLNIQLINMGEIESMVKSNGEFYFTSVYDVEESKFIFTISKVGDSISQESMNVWLKNEKDYFEFIKAFRLFRYMIELENTYDTDKFYEQLLMISE